MASPDSLAGPLRFEPRRSLRTSLLVRLCVWAAGPKLDAELADGLSPRASILLRVRADWITRPRGCRAVAQALRGAVEAARRTPDRGLSSRVPVDADAVLVCRDDLLALAETLSTIEQPSAYGVAIARQLALDGQSPLFLQAPDRRHGANRRLACTLEAAQRALVVSADFDSTQPYQRQPDERRSEMAVETKMTAEPAKTVKTRDAAPVVDDGSGTRDLIIGFGLLGACAFVAIALGIILSLT
jgi:hypothetical protein